MLESVLINIFKGKPFSLYSLVQKEKELTFVARERFTLEYSVSESEDSLTLKLSHILILDSVLGLQILFATIISKTKSHSYLNCPSNFQLQNNSPFVAKTVNIYNNDLHSNKETPT